MDSRYSLARRQFHVGCEYGRSKKEKGLTKPIYTYSSPGLAPCMLRYDQCGHGNILFCMCVCVCVCVLVCLFVFFFCFVFFFNFFFEIRKTLLDSNIWRLFFDPSTAQPVAAVCVHVAVTSYLLATVFANR